MTIENEYHQTVDPTEEPTSVPILVPPAAVLAEEAQGGLEATQLTQEQFEEQQKLEAAAAEQLAKEVAEAEAAYIATIPALDPEKGLNNIRQVDLRGEFLYLINRQVFHPRGYQLGISDDGTCFLLGDGSMPFVFGDDIDETQLLKRIKAWLP